MFLAERWAEAFVYAAGAFDGGADIAGPEESIKNAREGLAFLRAVFPLIREIPGEVAGSAAAFRLERMLRAAAAKSAVEKTPGLEAALRLTVLLVKKDGLRFGDAVTGAIEQIIDRRRGLLEGVLESAAPPEENFLEDLKKVLIKKTGAREIRILPRIRPELLGGFRLRLGDEVLDASLRGQIRQMAADLEAAPREWDVSGLSDPGANGGNS
jgi:F-type H+-transporting ATPase subunit delta